MLAAIPLLLLPAALYNILVLAPLDGGFQSVLADDLMGRRLFVMPMASGGHWAVNLGDLLTFVTLGILFIELLKSTTSRKVVIVNHSLSMILFIACLIEFLLFRAFATTSFFLLTSMVLLDVLAGFIVTIVASRRDIDVIG